MKLFIAPLSYYFRSSKTVCVSFPKVLYHAKNIRNPSHCFRNLHNFPDLRESNYHNVNELNLQLISQLISVPENDERLLRLSEDLDLVRAKRRKHPEFLNLPQISELYTIETRTQRCQYLLYLFKKEKLNKSEEEKRLIKKENKKTEKTSPYTCDTSRYGLGNNTLLLNVRKKSMNRFNDLRVAYSALFGNKIVIDLSYDKHMLAKERTSCVSQLGVLIGVNRKNQYPFDLYFCNANSASKCVRYFKKTQTNISESLVSLHEESYLDMFTKEQLVYLSPHAEESLKTFDPNAIYIIGGFVDIVKKEKVSFGKASIEGIKSYSLPLDDYIQWKAGTKSLTINQVFEIMLILKNTGDWMKAFECVPQRKAQTIEFCKEEDEHLLQRKVLSQS